MKKNITPSKESLRKQRGCKENNIRPNNSLNGKKMEYEKKKKIRASKESSGKQIWCKHSNIRLTKESS